MTIFVATVTERPTGRKSGCHMLEPDVTLTDFALAVECAVFAGLLFRRNKADEEIERNFAFVFAALGASSLFGGIWHGMFSASETTLGRLVWFTAMVALALAAFSLWQVAAALLPTGRWSHGVRKLSRVHLAGQVFVSAFVTDAFAVGAFGMVPPIAFVTALLFRRHEATCAPRALAGIAGFTLAIASGLVIAFGVSLHPMWATTLAIYHALQFVAFWLVFLSIPAAVAQTR